MKSILPVYKQCLQSSIFESSFKHLGCIHKASLILASQKGQCQQQRQSSSKQSFGFSYLFNHNHSVSGHHTPQYESCRHYCDGGGGVSSGSSTDSSIKLPKRLLKRLQKQGITEDEFVTKLKLSSESSKWNQPIEDNVNSAEAKLNSTVKDYLVNKLPLRQEHADIPEFPSDMPRYKEWKSNNRRMQNKGVSTKQNVDPSQTSILLFPGQGSQFVGMGNKLIHFPGVKELYAEASQILGYDLLDLCQNGPKSELDKTVHCQPSVVVTSLAAVEKLREEYPNAIEQCVGVAGNSVGEFAALVFSGVLSFPDAVSAVKVRAEAMQRASEQVSSGMLSVFLAHDSDLKGALAMAREYCKERRGIPDPVCFVANYLFPECKVIGGHSAALEFLTSNGKEFGLLRSRRLPVSGAFHTQLMKSAVPSLEKVLQHVQLNQPKIPVYSNLTGQRYHPKTNFIHKLGLQITRPVKWEQTMHAIYSRSTGHAFPMTFELGPSKQLGTLLKQVNMQAYKQYQNIEV